MTSFIQHLTAFTGTALIASDGKKASFASLVSNAKTLRANILAHQDGSKNCGAESLSEKEDKASVKESSQQQEVLPFSSLTEFVTGLLALDSWAVTFSILSDRFTFAIPTTYKVDEHTDSTWYLYTSGTTGEPKQIAHNAASICASLSLRTSPSNRRWALTYKPYKFAGLQVLLQSLLDGDCILDCTSGNMEEKARLLMDNKINALSATPSWWRQLLMIENTNTLPLSHITLGGEIADQNLLTALDKSFPFAKIFHIYASTEAGVGFAVSDKKAGFPLSWTRDGVNRNLLDIRQNILWIKPFFNNAKLQGNSESIQVDNDGFINTQDAVYVEDERVHFRGRVNGAINVGGNKVFPEAVEKVLLMSDLVVQARVYGKENKILGNVVVADVVVKTTTKRRLPKDLQMALLLHCKTYLNRTDMPTKINIVDELTLSDSGKLARTKI